MTGSSPHRPSSPRPPLPAPVGRLLEPLYALELARRNRRYDRGIGVTRLPIPVISVGNLSVGGTGKTPMVTHLARELLAAGHHPAIAMRGYVRGRGSHGHGQASDEARQYRRVLEDVPVVAQPDRAAGIAALLASDAGRGVDCILLDDGFQHRRLARDFDIVLIDAARSPFEDRLLPAGWLREPVSSLGRADAVVITHAELATPEQIGALQDRIAQVPCHRDRLCDLGALRPVTRHVWTGLRVAEPRRANDQPAAALECRHPAGPRTPADRNWANQIRAVDYLTDKRAVAVCAIGSPDGFIAQAAAACRELTDRIVLPDHDRYAPKTVARIVVAAKHADIILTTEKDWSKLSRRRPGPARGRGGADRAWPVPIARPILTLTFDGGREDLTSQVLDTVRATNAALPSGRS